MLVRIVAYVWIANLAVLMITDRLLAARLGIDKPDATHSYLVHSGNRRDLFYNPLLGLYINRVGPGIFMGGWVVGLLYVWLSRPKSEPGSKDS